MRRKPECFCAVDRYGYTNDLDDAGFIMPDGKMLNLRKNKMWPDWLEHEDVAYCLKKEKDLRYGMSRWLEICNAVRINRFSGSIIFESVAKPTSEQVETMLRFIDEEHKLIGYRNRCPQELYINLDEKGFSKDEDCYCTFKIQSPRKMDVQRWISKCW